MRRIVLSACLFLSFTDFSQSYAAGMSSDSASRSATLEEPVPMVSMQELPLEERIMIGMGLLMAKLQQSSAYIDQLRLPSADLTKVQTLVLTEKDFFAELSQQKAAELERICSWGNAADASVFPAAMMALDEQSKRQIEARYLTLLDSLSTEGRKQLESQLLDETKSGLQMKTNFTWLAADPDLLKQEVLRRCGTGESRTIQAIPIEPASKGDQK